jgi:hypothetical protein
MNICGTCGLYNRSNVSICAIRPLEVHFIKSLKITEFTAVSYSLHKKEFFFSWKLNLFLCKNISLFLSNTKDDNCKNHLFKIALSTLSCSTVLVRIQNCTKKMSRDRKTETTACFFLYYFFYRFVCWIFPCALPHYQKTFSHLQSR